MKHLLHIIFVALLFSSVKMLSQDKLFLKNGTIVKCKIMAISEITVSYRDTLGNDPLITIPKVDVLIAEYKAGGIYIFGQEKKMEVIGPNGNETREQRQERKMNEWKDLEATLPNGILGFYIPELALGRLTISYERLLANKSMGIKVPFSLTYNPMVALYNASTTSSSTSTGTNSSGGSSSSGTRQEPTRGVGFITGVDINYYHDLKPQLKYYFGPRIRYGTDMLLGGIEGLTVQLQNGIFKSSGKRMTSTLGVGFGFFKLSQKYANYPGYEPKQVYPWASFTWRLGFRL